MKRQHGLIDCNRFARDMGTESRKSDHIRICLEEDVSAQGITPGFERYRFVHQALPEIDLRDVDTSLALWGRALRVPLLISSMTGGAPRAEEINRNLALGAQELGWRWEWGRRGRP